MTTATPNSQPADHEMSLLEHLRELRRRLVSSIVVLAVMVVLGFILFDYYIDILLVPFAEAEQPLNTFTVEEALIIRFKLAIYAGIILSLPVHGYNIIGFVLPALKRRERRVLGAMLAASLMLVMFGAYLAYFHVLPLAIPVLTEFKPELVESTLNYSKSLMFVCQLLLAFMTLFQLPLVLLILMAMGLIRRSQLLKYSRYFIVAIFVAAALLTPPDYISQVALAVPLIFFYYGAILAAKICHIGDD